MDNYGKTFLHFTQSETRTKFARQLKNSQDLTKDRYRSMWWELSQIFYLNYKRSAVNSLLLLVICSRAECGLMAWRRFRNDRQFEMREWQLLHESVHDFQLIASFVFKPKRSRPNSFHLLQRFLCCFDSQERHFSSGILIFLWKLLDSSTEFNWLEIVFCDLMQQLL